MKLIVDIDENDYELFKNSTIKPDWDTMWHGKEKDKEIMFATVGLIECLKNGIPCSSEGDLISRSALRDEVQRISKTYTEMSANQLGYAILRAIDSTPTVELGRSQGEWAKGFHEGFKAGNMLAEAFNERPEGEWIRKEDVICSIAKQYSAHNELVPVWLSIGDIKDDAE